MSDVFIVDAIRTPIGRGKSDGVLHQVHPVDLLAQTLEALMTHARMRRRIDESGSDGLGQCDHRRVSRRLSVPTVAPGRFRGNDRREVGRGTRRIGRVRRREPLPGGRGST
jgi:acetyl-CoA acetyltransferase